MDWIITDVRQTNLLEINSNTPTLDHIKFRKVTGIDGTGSYTFDTHYIEWSYGSAEQVLNRFETNGSTSVWTFNNIMQSPFYTAEGQSLVQDDILSSKKLHVVIAAQQQLKHAEDINFTLIGEVKIRN